MYIVVKCFKCNVHQVVQRTKATGKFAVSKWDCRMCDAKRQSVTQVYSEAPQAAGLRPIAQELNMRQGRDRERRERQGPPADAVAAPALVL